MLTARDGRPLTAMAFYPRAERKLLAPENRDEPYITPIGVIFHSAASTADSLYSFFQNSSNLESHFYIRLDGTVEQYMDTARCADANLKANIFHRGGVAYGYLSVETENQSRDHDADTWTHQQVDAIVALWHWARIQHAIPQKRMAGPYTPGFGYHTMDGAPSWLTPVSKTCPGVARVRQFNDEVQPRLLGGAPVGPPRPPFPTGEFMPALNDKDQQKLADQVNAIDLRVQQLQQEVIATVDGDGLTRIDRLANNVDRALASLTRIEKALKDGAGTSKPKAKAGS